MTATQPAKRVRTGPRQRVRLAITNRDLDVLATLTEVRFLTAQALGWLHFDDPAQPYPASRTYRRLRMLARAGLLVQICRPVRLSATRYGRDSDLYAVSRAGAEWVAAESERPLGQLHHERRGLPAPGHLAHSADLGTAYAAIRAAVERMPGVELEDWRGDHITHREHDGIQPDGVFRLAQGDRAVLCFLELDRERPVETWKAKIRAYERYSGSAALQARYGAATFMLLAVTTNATWRYRLLAATAGVLGRASNRHLFAAMPDVHPDTIGAAWRKIAGVEPLRQERHVLLDMPVRLAGGEFARPDS